MRTSEERGASGTAEYEWAKAGSCDGCRQERYASLSHPRRRASAGDGSRIVEKANLALYGFIQRGFDWTERGWQRANTPNFAAFQRSVLASSDHHCRIDHHLAVQAASRATRTVSKAAKAATRSSAGTGKILLPASTEPMWQPVLRSAGRLERTVGQIATVGPGTDRAAYTSGLYREPRPPKANSLGATGGRDGLRMTPAEVTSTLASG